MEVGKRSPPASQAATPTQILENGYSPDVMSRPTRTSEWMPSVAMLGAPGLRSLACTDLSKHFEDMYSVTHTQVWDGAPNATFGAACRVGEQVVFAMRSLVKFLGCFSDIL